jgi:autotransporter-associated beta strand protein
LRSAGNSACNLNVPLNGTHGFAEQGTGTLWLNGNNSALSGTLVISAGRVFNNNANGLGSVNVSIASGSYLAFWTGGAFAGNFTLNGIGRTIDGQTKNTLYADNTIGAEVIINGAVTMNATSDVGGSTPSASITFNGPITGSGGLIKSGPGGLLVLAGAAKAYSGPTLVSNGSLVVDAELLASPVTNSRATTLSGIGRIDTLAVVMGGAAVAPGHLYQAGTLTISNLYCQAQSSIAFKLNPVSRTEGGQINDELLVNNLSLSGPVTAEISFLPDAIPVSGRYVLLRYGGTVSGLTNLALSPAFAAQSFQPALDLSVPGQVALVIASGTTPQPSQPKHSGIFYSTLFAKTGQYVRIQSFGTDAAQLFLRDVNGDGHDDAVAYYTNSAQLGQWTVALGNGQVFSNPTVMATFPTATPGMKPLMADVNGDGRWDACLFDPATGSWWVALSNGSNFGMPMLFSAGNGVGSTDQFLADVNGDARADALIYFNTSGLAGKWYVGLSSGSGFGTFIPWLSGFDTNSTQRLVGDANGDGKADVASFTQSSGKWSVALSSGSAFAPGGLWLTNFGTDAQQAFLFDADRDGRADAVFVQSNSSDWWVVYSTGSTFNDSYRDRWIAGLNPPFLKEGFPAPQAELLGSLNPGMACACAVTLGDWFVIENGNKYATSVAGEMDTWASWGNNYIPQLPGSPGTYESGDSAINDLQTGMIHDAGFDYLMFDDTNGRAGWVESRISNFIGTLRRWNQKRALGQQPVYFCISEGASREQPNWQQVIEQESRFVWTSYYAANQDVYYKSLGKPLLIHFVADPTYSSNFLAWTGDKTYSSQFTIRWMYNYIANGPAWANAYGWQVAAKGGNPVGTEVMDVMPGFWNGGAFTSREDGDFYASQWQRVIQYKPSSVWVNSLNETWEHTSVEPAWLHGRWVANSGITRWNDYYGDRMDDFYWQMTRRYNQLFRNNVLVDGSYIRESGSTDVYRITGTNYVAELSLPHQAPVMLLPTGFRASFTGSVVASNFSGWSSPISLYNFDEASGSTVIDSLGGLDGQINTGATRGPGFSGMSLVVDGLDGYARLPQNLTASFSLVFWMRTSAATSSATNWWQGQVALADENSSATNGFGLTLLTGGRLAFGLSTTNRAVAVQSLNPIADGAWHQVAATRDSVIGDVRLYVDGILQGSANGTAGTLPSSDYLRLGGGLGVGSFLAGAFDTLQVYNQVLSAPTVAVLVTNPPAATLVYGPQISNGNFRVRFAGLPGQNYVVNSTVSLAPPNWQATTNLTAPTTDQGLGVGVFEFVAPINTITNQFYRVQMSIPQ